MKTKQKTYKQEYYNGQSCGNSACGDEINPCPHCGRIYFRGKMIIQNRTGFVYLERMNEFNKLDYLKKSKEEQEKSTIELYLPPIA